MDILKLMENDIAKYIAIITAGVPVLSQILYLIEYLRLKAKWDYYYLDDIGREIRKTGFHIEYFATSLFIITITYFIVSFDIIMDNINNIFMIFLLLLISVVIFILSFIIFYIFSRYDVEKGFFSQKEYFHITIEKARLTTIKYSLQMFILYLLCLIILGEKNKHEVLILIIISGCVLVFFEYNNAKIRIAHCTRELEIVFENNEVYCILSCINNQYYYMVKAEIDNINDTIKLHLDTKLIRNVEGVLCKKKIFKRIKRIYGDREIKIKKFFIG